MQQPVRRAIGSALITSCLVLLVAAGVSAQVATLEEPGSSPEPSAAAPALGQAGADDPREAMLAFAQCMRDNGIEMDDPRFDGQGRGVMIRIAGGGGSDVDPESEAFRAAQEACAPILEASRPQLDPAAQAELLERQLAMAQCLRDNGIDGFPDPVLDADGRLQRFVGPGAQELPFDPTSEAFRLARETCAEQLGVEGAGGPVLGGPPRGVTP